MIQVQGKGKGRAPYQVDYTVLSPKELEEGMRREISHVASALSLNVSWPCWMLVDPMFPPCERDR